MTRPDRSDLFYYTKIEGFVDSLEKELKENETTNQLLVTANDNLIKQIEELKAEISSMDDLLEIL